MMRLTAGPMRENAGGIFIRNAYDVVVAFISSKVTAPTSRADILLLQEDSGFAASGLKVDSVIKLDKIATIMKKFILGELGALNKELRVAVNEKMREIASDLRRRGFPCASGISNLFLDQGPG